MLKEEIENSYKAANLSLQYKVHIDPSQVTDFEAKLKGEAPEKEIIPSTNNESILMQDSQGKQYQIPTNEVNDALQDGLILVEG
jgi:hypothetical protein